MKSVKRIVGAAALGLGILIASDVSCRPAQAGYIVTLVQEGSDVVASGSGTIDLAGLSPNCPTSCTTNAGILPGVGAISTGPVNAVPSQFYTGFAGPTSFGTGDFSTLPSSGSGDIVAIDGTFEILSVALDYVSGSALSDTSTYGNQTFSSLGVTPGTYTWTWGSGATADSFTLEIEAAAVPEPSSLLLGVAFAALLISPMSRRVIFGTE
jgi:hypothetical protein